MAFECHTGDAVVELCCPFAAGLSPHVALVQRNSLDWCRRQRLVSGDDGRALLDESKIGWLVARAFWMAPRQPLQLASDWTHWFCLLDDRSEAIECPIELSALFVGLQASFDGGSPRAGFEDDPFAAALCDLHRRMREFHSPTWMRRFSSHLKAVFAAFLWEGLNRSTDRIPDLGAYLAMREFTVGLYPQFHLAELVYDFELPADIRRHPAIQRLMRATSNCVGWTNDLCTFAREIAAGEPHNLVHVLLREGASSVAEAVRCAVRMHDEEVEVFQQVERTLPDFGDHAESVRRFVAVLGAWMSGHLAWARESGRYAATYPAGPT